MRGQRYFITATGTDVGKTFVTVALTRQLRSRGLRVAALKPVISGFDEHGWETSDTALLLAAQGLPVSLERAHTISPWRFAAPLSPDMAAEEENSTLSLPDIVHFCEQHTDADVCLIEGAGGIMSPLAPSITQRELLCALQCPAILVAGTYLGSLSHTLTAYQAIASMDLPVQAIVVSESEHPAVPLERHVHSLRSHLPRDMRIYTVARQPVSQDAWKQVPDLTGVLYGRCATPVS